ncbi:MAG: hypothetical protein AB7I27_08110 [Bacteriovoracaceae bacterium]
MKSLLFISSILLLSSNIFAGQDKGNGGSGSEAELVTYQEQLETVSFKIRSFFLRNEERLSLVFPEFNIKSLIKTIKTTDLSVVNEAALIDKYGKSRTCLNFSETSQIKCNYTELTPLLNQPTAIFVLMLHEYLGILGVEETSPLNASMIDGYSISKRLGAYVSKVSSYDLVINPVEKIQRKVDLSNKNVPEVMIWSDDYVTVPKSTKKLLVRVKTNGALPKLSSAGYVVFVRDPSEKEFKVLKKGNLDDTDQPINKNLTMDFEYEAGKIYVLRIMGEAHRSILTMSAENPKPFSESFKITSDSGEVLVDTGDIPVVTDKNDPNAYSTRVAVLNFQLYFR